MKHQNHAIYIRGALKSYDFSKHGGEAKLFNLDFLSGKFSYPNERVRFSTKGLEHKNRTQCMSRAPSSFNNMSRSEFGYCDTYGLLIFCKFVLIKKNNGSSYFSRLNLA